MKRRDRKVTPLVFVGMAGNAIPFWLILQIGSCYSLLLFENHYKSNNSNNYPDKSKWEIAKTCQHGSIHFCATCT